MAHHKAAEHGRDLGAGIIDPDDEAEYL